MQRLRSMSLDPTTAPRFILLAGILISPSFFDLGSVKPFDVSKVVLLWFFGWLAFGLTVIEMLRGTLRPVWFRMGTIAALFIASAGLATLFSVTRGVSTFGWYGRYNGFVELALYVVIFWLVVQLYWRRPERLKEVFFAMAAASIILTGYVLIQWLGLDPIKWVQPNGQKAFRYFGTMGNSDFAGGYLGATSAWLVFAFWRAKRLLSKLAIVAWALVTLVALWETSSRGGLAAIFATGCAAVFVFRHRLPSILTVATAVVAALVVVGGLAISYRGRAVHPPSPRRNPPSAQATAPPVLRTSTIVIRTYWWRAALAVFASRPLTGAGPDTFVVEYPHHALAEAAKQRGTERTDEPHNILLEHASSLGILGIGSYLALIFFAFRWGLRRMRALREARADPLESELLGAFLAMVVGYLGQGVFSIDVAALATIGWVALAGVAAFADPSLVSDRSRLAFAEDTVPRRIGSLRRAATFAATVLIAALIVAGLRPWLADRAAKQAQRDASATASTEIVMQSYNRAMSLAPYEPVYHELAANFLTTQAQNIDDKDVQTDLLSQAVELEKQTDRLQPGNAFWKITIGSGLTALASVSNDVSGYEESEAWFADAATLAPNDYRVSLQHALMLNRWGRATHDGLKYCQAISEFHKSNALRPQTDVAAGLGQAYAAIGHIDQALDALHAGLRLDPTSKQLQTLSQRVKALRKRRIKVINCD